VLRELTRADDLAARYGGEEFALLMSRAMEDTVEVAERIRRGVEGECSPERDASVSRRITVSLGVASLTEGAQTLEQLIEAPDREMYRAKRAGKIVYLLSETHELLVKALAHYASWVLPGTPYGYSEAFIVRRELSISF